MAKLKLKDAAQHVDIPALIATGHTLMDAGHTKEETIDQIVDMVDAIIPWGVVPVVGAALEAGDGPVIKAFVRLLLSVHLKKRAA